MKRNKKLKSSKLDMAALAKVQGGRGTSCGDMLHCSYCGYSGYPEDGCCTWYYCPSCCEMYG